MEEETREYVLRGWGWIRGWVADPRKSGKQ